MTRFTVSKTKLEKNIFDGSYMAISAMAVSMRSVETPTGASLVIRPLISKAV